MIQDKKNKWSNVSVWSKIEINPFCNNMLAVDHSSMSLLTQQKGYFRIEYICDRAIMTLSQIKAF